MTEQEWLTCADPAAMLEWIRTQPGDRATRSNATAHHVATGRQLRLFACACCLRNGTPISVVDDYELQGIDNGDGERVPDAHWAREWAGTWGNRKPTQAEKAALLRDIFGNPFAEPMEPAVKTCSKCNGNGGRWVTNDPICSDFLQCRHCKGTGKVATYPWLTPNVLAVAQSIYAERRFEDMPILADALEEAGCMNEDILGHCRGPKMTCPKCDGYSIGKLLMCSVCDNRGRIPTPHVRGCWVLDLIGGRQ